MSATRARVSPLQSIVALTFVTGMLWLLFSPASPINKAPEAKPPAETTVAPEGKQAPRPRVASTSPAITDSLVALGLVHHVVGRSPFCRSVPESIPVVGDLRDFDAERLAIVAPDVLFVQPPLAGVDPALRDFCAVKRIPLVDRRLDSLAELGGLVDDIASTFRVAPDAAGDGLAKRLADAKAALAPVAAPAAGARRTLLLVSAEPFLAVGRGSYLDELLSRSGAANALERDGYVELGAEAIVALAPDCVLVVAETDRGAARALELLRALPWPESRTPPTAARAVPELLSPSLAAVARAGVLGELAAEAR